MKILIIEDNQDHQELIQDEILQAFGDNVELDVSATLYGGLAALTSQDFDLMLFDLNLPDSKASNTIEEIKKLQLQIPVIALSSLDNVEYARSLLSAGVQDYLTKDQLDSAIISRAVTYATERKRFERVLQREIEDKDVFCYSLSHDFRGPIRRIDAYSDRLLTDKDSRLSERSVQSVENIRHQCQHVQCLIDGLVSYIGSDSDSKDEPFKPVDLNATIRQIEAANGELFEQRGVALTCALLPTILGLEAKLYLMFENLITNAIKHNEAAPVINIRATHLEQSVRIEVQDNGLGIEDFFIEQIFLPFRKKHANKWVTGSGLGLSIARKIATQHQGVIGVTSIPGAGSTFYLEFPRRVVVDSAVSSREDAQDLQQRAE